jgi:hypothetical protein
MDWAVFSMLGATAKDIKTLTFSYDICCAWSVNFRQRLEDIYGSIYQIPDDLQITFVIPKFHLEAHGEDCKSSFNLNYTIGAARTCGEGIEAGWADTNPVALSTREMSLTHRHEVLDDLFGAINWRKMKTMGTFRSNAVVSFITSFRCSTLTEFTRGNTHGEKTLKTIYADEHNRSRVSCDVMGEPNPGLGRIRIQKETCKK